MLNSWITTSCGFYLLIYAKTNFYVHIRESRCDKILKTHDYFQNIEINVVFLSVPQIEC